MVEFRGRDGVHKIRTLVIKGHYMNFGKGGGRGQKYPKNSDLIYGCPLVDSCLSLVRDYSILDMNSIFDLDSWLGTLLKGLTINHIYKMSLKLSKTIFIKKIP